jgi:hypothetical protein
LRVRPTLAVADEFDVDWPGEVEVTVGQPRLVPAALRREHANVELIAPFRIGTTITTSGVGLEPVSLVFEPGEAKHDVAITAKATGMACVQSRLPRSLGGSRDDVEIVAGVPKKQRKPVCS